MNIGILRTEIINDPINRGYSNMNDEEVVDSLTNTIDRVINRNSISPREMQAAVIGSEFNTLSAGKQRAWIAILSDSIDPNNANTISQIAAIWENGTSTRVNLLTLKTETVSRLVELDLGKVKVGYVQQARA